jgi:hypothetical protein
MTDDRVFIILVGIIALIALIIASYGLATQANEKLKTFEDLPTVELVKPGDTITVALEKLETRAILASLFSIPESTSYANPINTLVFQNVLGANTFVLLGTNVNIYARFVYIFEMDQKFTLSLNFSQGGNSYSLPLAMFVPLSVSPGFVIDYVCSVSYRQTTSGKITLSFLPQMNCVEATNKIALAPSSVHDFDLTKSIDVECFVTISDVSQSNFLTLQSASAAYR